MLIAPSIFASIDLRRLGDYIAMAEHGGADWIHLDVMDGHFVPNISFGPVLVEAVRQATTLPLDVHLMITDPERYIDAFARAGADRVTVHVEATPHIYRALDQIHDLGKLAGVALNPGTPAESVSTLLDNVELILAMTVSPGYSGQRFIHAMLPKIERLCQMIKASGRPIHLQVDGGVDATTAPLCRAAGADVIVAASAVYKAGKPVAEAIAELRGTRSEERGADAAAR